MPFTGWPGVTSTGALDEAVDDMNSARVQVEEMALKVNQIIQARGANSGIAPLNSSGRIATANDASGRVVTLTASRTLATDDHGTSFVINASGTIAIYADTSLAGLIFTVIPITNKDTQVICTPSGTVNGKDYEVVRGKWRAFTFKITSSGVVTIGQNLRHYSGFVDHAAGINRIPADWTYNRISTGVYQFTHGEVLASNTLARYQTHVSYGFVDLLSQPHMIATTGFSTDTFTTSIKNMTTGNPADTAFCFNVTFHPTDT